MTDMSQGNSRRIESNQAAPHDRLSEVVGRHLKHVSQKPFSDHTVKAFEVAQRWLADHQGPIILDSCCGTGESTRVIAGQHPQARIIGVDKSIHRLEKHSSDQADNYLLLQADLNDFWRLARDAKWSLEKHFILYPNPYPKRKHLQRRWHAMPCFADIIGLGGELTVRSNWQIYIQEFVIALGVAGFTSECELYPRQHTTPITAFERKYWLSGQDSWQLVCNL
jgi:tRNA (guanine-N7-)-methyltransferase